MNTIRITAAISSVFAPKPLLVVIDNKDDNGFDKEYRSRKSFDQEFEAGTGRYVIKIFGMNQIEGSTTITVSGDFEEAQSQSSDEVDYVMYFVGTVN